MLSDWALLEATSVIARLVRVESLAEGDGRTVLDLVSAHLEAGLYERVTTGSTDVERACRLVARLDLPLRAPDAMHVALSLGHQLTLVTGDRQLARAAERAGARVERCDSGSDHAGAAAPA